MHKELIQTAMWSLVPFPTDKHCIGWKQVFEKKHYSDESIDRVQGPFTCCKRIYTSKGVKLPCFFTNCKLVTTWLLLVVTIHCHWPLYEVDVKNAFLHDPLHEEVYIKLLSGHPRQRNKNLVSHFYKSLYSLKQDAQMVCCFLHLLISWFCSI